MRKCNLQVKELILINSEVDNIKLEWVFIKEVGKLAIRVKKTPNETHTRSETKINIAHRDYGEWM